MPSDDVMPAVFFGHGTPMNALETNRYTEAWSAFGASVSRPRAILSISAHWFINASAVTAMAAPRTIHDFFGFPDELFALQYPAPGIPSWPGPCSAAADPVWVGRDEDSWGLDHGTWSVLVHAFPAADVPVVQLALDGTKPLQYHLELGAKLAPLRDEGVLIMASGNTVHHLGRLDWNRPDAGYDWAVRFGGAVADRLLDGDPAAVARLDTDPDFALARPRPTTSCPSSTWPGWPWPPGSTARRWWRASPTARCRWTPSPWGQPRGERGRAGSGSSALGFSSRQD